MAWMACNPKMDPEDGPAGSNSRVSYGVTAPGPALMVGPSREG